MALQSLSLLLLLLSTEYIITMLALSFLWGIGVGCIGLALQIRVLRLAPDATDVATAIYSGIYNAGIGTGALFGNIATVHLGLEDIGYFGAIFGVVGLIIFVATHLKYHVN